MRMRDRGINAPDDFSPEARKLWASAQRQLRAQGSWSGDADAALLEAWVRAVILARSARAMADREPIVVGSRGQPVPHPGLRIAAEAELRAARFAGELLLSPKSRAAAGITTKVADDDLAKLLA